MALWPLLSVSGLRRRPLQVELALQYADEMSAGADEAGAGVDEAGAGADQSNFGEWARV
jgi:hypothetical protein